MVSGTETVDPDGSETFGPFPKRDVVEGTQLYIQLNNEEREPIEVDFSIGYVDLAIDDDGNIDVNYAEI
ncbi:hypothetical protein AArcS_1657 [Natranaeroarchaeum sulfidigenes]|uniref:Uncharacterized protein n=1 Tax=Natranaeroarchaeum sulfidigenes TaxID=2784880 RepID=A0A897MQQ6_9EURY|nr:hypothetical protein AArcS_1657 [Natranaeroarchaeum sulfidigenes]